MKMYRIVTDLPLGSRDGLLYNTKELAREAFEDARLDYVTGLDLLHDMDPCEYEESEDEDWNWEFDVEEVEVDENDPEIRALFVNEEDCAEEEITNMD